MVGLEELACVCVAIGLVSFEIRSLVTEFYTLQSKQNADSVDRAVPRVSFSGANTRTEVEVLFRPRWKEAKFRE